MVPTKLAFAADLGGTHLRSAAIDELGQIYHRSKTPTPRSSDPDHIVRALVDAFKNVPSMITSRLAQSQLQSLA